MKRKRNAVNTVRTDSKNPTAAALIVFLCLCVPPYRIESGGQIYLFEPVVLIYATVLMIINRNRTLYVPRWAILQILFISSSFLSMALGCLRNGTQMAESFLKIVRLVEIVAVFYIVFVSIKSQHSLQTIVNSVLIAGTLSAIIGVLGFIFQIPDLVAFQRIWSDVTGFSGMYRAGSFFQNTGIFGSLCCLLSVFSLALLLSNNGIVSNGIAATCAVFNIIGLICSLSRAGIVALLAGVLILYCTQLMRSKNVLVLLGATLVIICISMLAYYAIPLIRAFLDSRISDLFSVLNGSLDVSNVSSGRVELWDSSLYDYMQSGFDVLVFGQGFAVDIDGLQFVDNNYLYIIIKGGVLVALSWYSSLICIVHKVCSTHANPLRTSMLCVCGSFLVLMGFGDVWTVLPPMTIFMTLFACFSRIVDYDMIKFDFSEWVNQECEPNYVREVNVGSGMKFQGDGSVSRIALK